MKKLTKVGVALGALAATLILPSVPATSAQETPSTPTGYTLVAGDSGCELAVIDLTTGALTDLAAGPSEDACALDLAASPAGVVYGITFEGGIPSSTPQAVDAASLVTYSMNGTPTLTPINVPSADEGSLIYGGIAVSASGTLYVHLVTDEAECDTGTTPDTTPDTVLEPEYAGDSVCLYTLNPSTGVATIVGTTGLFETPFFGLASCGSLTSISFAQDSEASIAYWTTENASTGEAFPGAVVQSFPVGYDCNSVAGSPLWALTSPESDGPFSPLATQVSVAQVDASTGTITTIVPVSDASADLLGLAVVPTAAPTPPPAASPAVVTPAFTG